MCIIIAAPAGFTLPKWELKNCWDNNNDGGGLMYVRNGKIIIAKEYLSWDKFYKIYSKHVQIAETHKSPMVLHFRIGTHGVKGIHNVHPFMVDNELAFCHNGVLQVPDHKKHSDSQMYNKIWLQNLPKGFHLNAAIIGLIEEHIGSSKFVFLDTKKNVVILNKSLGEFDTTTGVWYSNTSFQNRSWYSKSYTKKSHGYYDHDDTEALGMWYTNSNKNSEAIVTVSASDKTPPSKSAIERLLPENALCDMCNLVYPFADLSSTSEYSSNLLCPKCKEDLKESITKNCMFCGQDIEEVEESVYFENGSTFCKECSEQLSEMGVLNEAA